jgi:hypothetical protein
VDRFFKKMHTPVDFEKEVKVSQDGMQYQVIGVTSLVIGGLSLLYLLLPNTTAARIQILILSLSIMSVGAALYSKKPKPSQKVVTKSKGPDA